MAFPASPTVGQTYTAANGTNYKWTGQQWLINGGSSGGGSGADADTLDGLDSTAFLKTSGGAMTGPINMGNQKITNLAAPTSASDAVPKSYVDAAVAGVSGGAMTGGQILTTLNGVDGSGSGLDSDFLDGLDSTAFLQKSGGAMSGPVDMSNNGLTGLPTPTSNTDAANKAYVDSVGLTDSAYDALPNLATGLIDPNADRIAIQDADGNVISYVTISQLFNFTSGTAI